VRRNHKINPLNAELIHIRYLLALLGTDHFLHVRRIWVKQPLMELGTDHSAITLKI